MGHIQYQRSYRNQSFLFRDGANPGFHEGVADILSLAVGSHKSIPEKNIYYKNAFVVAHFLCFSFSKFSRQQS